MSTILYHGILTVEGVCVNLARDAVLATLRVDCMELCFNDVMDATEATEAMLIEVKDALTEATDAIDSMLCADSIEENCSTETTDAWLTEATEATLIDACSWLTEATDATDAMDTTLCDEIAGIEAIDATDATDSTDTIDATDAIEAMDMALWLERARIEAIDATDATEATDIALWV